MLKLIVFLVCSIVLPSVGFAQPGDVRSAKEIEDLVLEASTEFTIESASLEKYVGVMIVKAEHSSEGVIRDIQAVFAVDEARKVERYEVQLQFDAVGHDTRFSEKRGVFNNNGKQFYLNPVGPPVQDTAEMSDHDRKGYQRMIKFHPFLTPIEFPSHFLVGSPCEEMVSIVMSPDRLFSSEQVTDSVMVGRYWHGLEKIIGATEVFFDIESKMPIEMKLYWFKGKEAMATYNENNFKEVGVLMSHNVCQRGRLSSGEYLPKRVRITEFVPTKSNIDVQLRWKTGKEVSDAFFDLKDFALSGKDESLLAQCVEQVKEAIDSE